MGRNEIISLELHLRTFLLSAGDGMLPRRHLLSHKCSPPERENVWRIFWRIFLEDIFWRIFLADEYKFQGAATYSHTTTYSHTSRKEKMFGGFFVKGKIQDIFEDIIPVELYNYYQKLNTKYALSTYLEIGNMKKCGVFS